MSDVLAVLIIGFIAQLLGGSLGMGYGVSASTGLIATGFSPAASSSVIHVVEIGTSLLNGAVHWRAKNVDWRVVLQIGLPGAAGAFCGAILLSKVSLEATKPWVALILLVFGLVILSTFVRGGRPTSTRDPKASWLVPLGTVAGFLDSSAGGGWGVMTTSALVVTKTMQPGRGAGTTSTARFLVALGGTFGFVIGLGISGINWLAVLGMLAGGLLALPFIGLVVRWVPQRVLGVIMGIALIALNARPIAMALGFSTWGVVSSMVLLPALAFGCISVWSRIRRP